MTLEITERYSKSLSPKRVRPTHAPQWIDDIDNPYLHGVFAPTTVEVSADELEVEGELPRDLYGAYFRNGPNPIHKPNNRYHWFDGDGFISGMWFEDGKARFANRWIQTEGLKMEAEQGSAIWNGVLGPFDFSLPGGPLKDTANTDLVVYNNRLVALWYESGKPYAMNLKTLETEAVEDFGGKWKKLVSAHSKIDPATGDFVFFSYGDRPPFMEYGVVKPDGTVHQTEITLPGPRRPHDIGMTPNYSILHDFPVFFSEEVFQKTGKRVPLFHPDVPTRYGIIPRYGSDADVKWFECEPCYMLHVVNCWEEGDWVVMVGCRTKDPTLRPNPADGKLAAALDAIKLQANLYEWRFNMATGEVKERDIDEYNAEFPMIASAWSGQSNRYAYLQRIPYEIPATFHGLIKYDIQTGSYDEVDYGEHVYGSEAPFCPRVGATTDEDDGYLVSFVTDTRDWTSACLVFNAKALSDGPVAKVKIPTRLPAGFHTTWVPGDTVNAA